MPSELQYQIALTLVPNIGDVQAKSLINRFGDAASIFRAKRKDLESVEGMGTIRAKAIRSMTDFSKAEKEIAFMEKFKIIPIFLTDPLYPKRLLNCYDSPMLLFYKGIADLNASKIISIVGTRNFTAYGKQVCEKIITDLAEHDILVVSGLAYGIDTIAHRAALKHGMKTIGVLAHGLDRIYPSENKSLAKQMLQEGGLLTDYKSNTNPDKQNFPRRNRIVAGMCDAVLVVETTFKGGSLITAELANGYNREVFTIPGRTTDLKSEGCNYLVRSNKAALVNSAADILENMGWSDLKKPAAIRQRSLFLELTAEERVIALILEKEDIVTIDELHSKSSLTSGTVASCLLTLEMQGLITVMPGKRYKLL